MYRPRSIPNSSPRGAKGVYGHCCQTPVTPLGFKRLLDTVFYIPVAPLGLKSCGYHFFYTPIAPLGLKSCGCFRCYKHIVPTGLKRVSRTRKTTKLTPMVRFVTAPNTRKNETNPVNLILFPYYHFPCSDEVTCCESAEIGSCCHFFPNIVSTIPMRSTTTTIVYTRSPMP